MRARSWMATLALMIGAAGLLFARGLSTRGPARAPKARGNADAPGPTSPPPMTTAMAPQPTLLAESADANADGAKRSRARLSLVIAGLGLEGCDVDIQPANAGCKFRVPPPRHVASEGTAQIVLNDIEVRGADQMLTVAITVREPGQPPETVYRGFRMTRPTTDLAAPPAPSSTPAVASFTCYLSSRVAGVEPATARR